jgi:hypothetical protein
MIDRLLDSERLRVAGAALSPLLPKADECLDGDGFGLQTCLAEYSRGWREESGAAAVIPLANWRGLYEAPCFALYLHPLQDSPMFVLWCNENSECVLLGRDPSIALLAFLCTSERGGFADREEDEKNAASRRRYWIRHGAALAVACGDSDLRASAPLDVAASSHCFGQAGTDVPWGYLRVLESRWQVPGFIASVVGRHVLEGQFDLASAALARIPSRSGDVSASLSWADWVVRAGLQVGASAPAAWVPAPGADWRFGGRWWNAWESALCAPLGPQLSAFGAGGALPVAQVLRLARQAADDGELAQAWTLATLINRAFAEVGTSCPRPNVEEWKQATALESLCLSESNWAEAIRALEHID